MESGEGGVRSEEMEELKRKYNSKIQDLESQLEAALAKASSLEKARNRLQGELEDLSVEVERVFIELSHKEECGLILSFIIILGPGHCISSRKETKSL